MIRSSIFNFVTPIIFLCTHGIYAADNNIRLKEQLRALNIKVDSAVVDIPNNQGCSLSLFEDTLYLVTFSLLNNGEAEYYSILESHDRYKFDLIATTTNQTLGVAIVSGFLKDSLERRVLVHYQPTGDHAVANIDQNKDNVYGYQYNQPNQITLLRELAHEKITVHASLNTTPTFQTEKIWFPFLTIKLKK